jgi:hypothetical protein
MDYKKFRIRLMRPEEVEPANYYIPIGSTEGKAALGQLEVQGDDDLWYNVMITISAKDEKRIIS